MQTMTAPQASRRIGTHISTYTKNGMITPVSKRPLKYLISDVRSLEKILRERYKRMKL